MVATKERSGISIWRTNDASQLQLRRVDAGHFTTFYFIRLNYDRFLSIIVRPTIESEVSSQQAVHHPLWLLSFFGGEIPFIATMTSVTRAGVRGVVRARAYTERSEVVCPPVSSTLKTSVRIAPISPAAPYFHSSSARRRCCSIHKPSHKCGPGRPSRPFTILFRSRGSPYGG